MLCTVFVWQRQPNANPHGNVEPVKLDQIGALLSHHGPCFPLICATVVPTFQQGHGPLHHGPR